MRPIVLVRGLGGTISMVDRGQGLVPAASAEELLEAVPALSGVAELAVETVRRIPGAHLSVDDIVDLASALSGELAGAASGAVVVQGTDTLEETAFLLDLLMDTAAPVVVTGAMRASSQAGADGAANLLAAVQVAASSEARGLGCLLVMNDEIHAARFVRKAHTSSPGAFRSFPGPVGELVEGQPRIDLAPRRRVRLPAPDLALPAPTIPIVMTGLGDDGSAIHSLSAGADALVVAAMGAGHVPVGVAEAISSAAARIPVVVTSRTGTGRVLKDTYGFVGSERDLGSRGAILSSRLDAVRARLVLHLLLRAQVDRAQIVRTFDVDFA